MLLLTPLALSCHAGSGPRKCDSFANSAEYAISGECSEDGVISLQAHDDDCDIDVTGAEELGLPDNGEFARGASYDLADGDWELGPPTWVFEGGNTTWDCTASDEQDDPNGVSLTDGQLLLTCEWTNYETSASGFNSCVSVLTPR